MTDRRINTHIRRMNKGKYSREVISPTVVKAQVPAVTWPDYTFFFIRNAHGEYVAAVLDMGETNLHCYTSAKHRRQGHMYNALHDHIFPYLKAQGRTEQTVTFCCQSEQLIQKLGFTIVSWHRAKLTL